MDTGKGLGDRSADRGVAVIIEAGIRMLKQQHHVTESAEYNIWILDCKFKKGNLRLIYLLNGEFASA